MADSVSKLTDKDLKKAAEQVKNIRKLISAMVKVGIMAPTPLTKALKVLERAIETEEDLGSSFEEASDALADYERDLYSICKTVDSDMQGVCEAEIATKYQARSVSYVLDPKNKKSMTSKFLQKTIKRYTPSLVCKFWDRCSK